METWNGLNMAEVRHCYLIDKASNLFAAVSKLADVSSRGELTPNGVYTFTTATDGAVIVDGNYGNWTFVAPDGFTVEAGETVGGVLDSLGAACAAAPVTAWERFARWFGESGAERMNGYVTEDGAVTVTDARGNTWAGTQRRCGAVSDFPEFLRWVKSWCGEEFLAAGGAAVYAGEKTLSWSFGVTVLGLDVTLTFTFKL